MLNGDYILKRESDKYNLSPLEYLRVIEKEDKRLELLILIKKILLSSNNSYYYYFISRIKKDFLFFVLKNLICLIIIIQIFFLINIFWRDSLFAKKYIESFPIDNMKMNVNRIIIIFIPELLIFLVYKFPYYLIKHKSILKLMFYINERYQYDYNNNSKNDLICKVDNNSYFDIHLYIKNKKNLSNLKLYSHSIKSLSKKAFYDYVIIYSKSLYFKFDYKMCNKKEIEIMIRIFEKLKQFNKNFNKINKYNLVYKIILIPAKCILELKGIKYNIITILFLKIFLLLLELYLKKIKIDDKMIMDYEIIKNKINKVIYKDGYFFDLNNEIIMLYRLKKEYRQMEDNYSYISNESRKILINK